MKKQCPKCGHEYDPEVAPELEGACPRCVAEILKSRTGEGSVAGGEDETPPLGEGARLGKFEVVEYLGRGGMGFVYKARQAGLDRFVALKVLAPRLAASPEFAERFNREAKALASLSHPNIVQVHDYGEENGLYFLVMEYVDGTSLRRVLSTQKLEAETALRYVPQICDALEYAHSQGVIHRDIKPENILLDRRGQLKIADFGLAKMASASPGTAGPGFAEPGRHATVSGRVLGTPHYMAPEQVEDMSSVDHRADIYSLGVVFYEMLTGELPLGRFPAPSQRVAVDVRFDEVVLKALEKEPEKRYQRASHLKTDVTHLNGSSKSAAQRSTATRGFWATWLRFGLPSGALAGLLSAYFLSRLWSWADKDELLGLGLAIGGAIGFIMTALLMLYSSLCLRWCEWLFDRAKSRPRILTLVVALFLETTCFLSVGTYSARGHDMLPLIVNLPSSLVAFLALYGIGLSTSPGVDLWYKLLIFAGQVAVYYFVIRACCRIYSCARGDLVTGACVVTRRTSILALSSVLCLPVAVAAGLLARASSRAIWPNAADPVGAAFGVPVLALGLILGASSLARMRNSSGQFKTRVLAWLGVLGLPVGILCLAAWSAHSVYAGFSTVDEGGYRESVRNTVRDDSEWLSGVYDEAVGISWGRPVNGVQAGLVADKPRFEFGQKLALSVHLQASQERAGAEALRKAWLDASNAAMPPDWHVVATPVSGGSPVEDVEARITVRFPPFGWSGGNGSLSTDSASEVGFGSPRSTGRNPRPGRYRVVVKAPPFTTGSVEVEIVEPRLGSGKIRTVTSENLMPQLLPSEKDFFGTSTGRMEQAIARQFTFKFRDSVRNDARGNYHFARDGNPELALLDNRSNPDLTLSASVIGKASVHRYEDHSDDKLLHVHFVLKSRAGIPVKSGVRAKTMEWTRTCGLRADGQLLPYAEGSGR